VGALLDVLLAVVWSVLHALVFLPGAIVTAIRTDVAWVQAVSHWPSEERYLWKTNRADAPTVRAAAIEFLSSGGSPQLARAELVEHAQG
jgi:hypothetical protein